MDFRTKPAYNATVFFAPRSTTGSGPLNYALGLLSAKPVATGETKSCHIHCTSSKDEASRNYNPKLNLFVNVPASERGSTRKDVLRGVATVHLMPAGEAGILNQGQMFAKWAFTHERVMALVKEASVYSNELRDLQGTVVPRVLGLYINKSKRREDPFAILILENCNPGVPGLKDQEEYQ